MSRRLLQKHRRRQPTVSLLPGAGPGRAREGWEQARSRAREAAGGRWAGGEQPRRAAGPGHAAEGLARKLGRDVRPKSETFGKHRVR